MTEQVIMNGTKEYKNLVAVAKMLEALSENDAQYVVKDVYLDFGQDWMWTTICRKGYKECQVLCPRDWRAIVEATTARELADVVEVLKSGKYFND